jgi:hypothetical protein
MQSSSSLADQACQEDHVDEDQEDAQLEAQEAAKTL